MALDYGSIVCDSDVRQWQPSEPLSSSLATSESHRQPYCIHEHMSCILRPKILTRPEYILFLYMDTAGKPLGTLNPKTPSHN